VTRVLLSALALALASIPASVAVAGDPSSNEQVERSIDEITEPPPYDWLRGPKPEAGAESGEPRGRPLRGKGSPPRSPRERPGQGDSCGYEPQPQDDGKPDVPDRPRPQGEGCSAGPATGGDVETGSGPETGGPDCGCEPTVGDCGCDRSIGDCGCGEGVGSSPGCGGLGAVGSGLGYVLGAVALGLIVFLVVRAILRRDKSRADEEIGEDALLTSPEEMRVSEVAALPAATMMERAAQAAMLGDYRTAVGWAYLAGISSLHRAGFTDLRISTTNMAIVASTRRHGGPHEPAARLVRVFEELFFGGREPRIAHWEECRAIVERELGDAPAV